MLQKKRPPTSAGVGPRDSNQVSKLFVQASFLMWPATRIRIYILTEAPIGTDRFSAIRSDLAWEWAFIGFAPVGPISA